MQLKNDKKYKIAIIAGEASGDVIGAKLIKALQKLELNFESMGIGGSDMQSRGFRTIFPIEDISVMGFTEVISSIPRIFWRLSQTISFIKKYKPDIIITIDAPGFNFRLVRRLRNQLKLKIPIIHYVAPSIWAYKPERAKLVAELYDHIFLILPFEKPYFDAVALSSTFVGHHAVENELPALSKTKIKEYYGLSDQDTIITIMPGSRKMEINKHIHIFKEAIDLLKSKHKNLKIVIPTLPHLVETIGKKFNNTISSKQKNELEQNRIFLTNQTNVAEQKLNTPEYSKRSHFLFIPTENIFITADPVVKTELIYISDVAITKSGTSILELMRYNIPMVTAYKLSKITAIILKLQLKIKFVSICNLILDQLIIPEYLQENCVAAKIAAGINLLLTNQESRNRQLESFAKVMSILGYGDTPSPSQKAALQIINILNTQNSISQENSSLRS